MWVKLEIWDQVRKKIKLFALTSLKWSKSALFAIRNADGLFCNIFILANERVAYLKLSRSVMLYTIKHESAHCICSIGKSLLSSVHTSTISTSNKPLSNDTVCRYNKSVCDRYSPINRLVKYRTVSAVMKNKEEKENLVNIN